MQPDADESWLVDMLVACRRIAGRTSGMTIDGYRADEDAQDVVERRLIVIGEAAGNLSKSFLAAHPEQPWADIIGMRHVVVHGYRKVDVSEVFRIAMTGVPALLAWLERKLGSPARDE